MAETPPIPAAPEGPLHIAPGPHAFSGSLTTRRMMIDVLIALAPSVLWSIILFRHYAVVALVLTVASCMAAEWLFMKMRGRKATLGDFSAVVTGVILALSLPAVVGSLTGWYVCIVGGFAAVGLGKIVFGSIGQNIFNPAMVGRAFVMLAFAALLGAGGYVIADSAVDAVTQATPMTVIKQGLGDPSTVSLLVGTTNGSLGEVNAIACLLGGAYLIFRRTAAWQIPAGVVISAAVIAGIAQLLGATGSATVLDHLVGGSLLFGAFFIATDPVSSPLTHKGRWIFGIGVGTLIMIIRLASSYPEGVMFSVLLMNAVVPLINRWTIPTPVGGPVPVRAPAKA